MPELWFTNRVPYVQAFSGISTPMGVMLPPGCRVAAFVRGNGTTVTSWEGDERCIKENLYPSINDGLAKCEASKGDVVAVLPGHTENISSAGWSNLKAGVRILGYGYGTLRPTLTWNATGSKLTLGSANVVLGGCILTLGGANDVTKAIDITAADVTLMGNYINFGSGASLDVAIGISVAAGGHRCKILGNEGVCTSVVGTSGIEVIGAADMVEIAYNRIQGAFVDATGQIAIGTGIPTNISIHHNILANTTANSSACISCGAVAATGVVYDNYVSTLEDNASPNTQGIILNAASLLRCFNNYNCDVKNTSGILSPAVTS